ncbi:BadF/BadG/BcrA/BcrD ATPase family protein [Kribbella sp. NPDC026611]|uniref:N-acetylglucosamine kinase n=1 Tax=Kribbella sp. NPDC026611 TaxID=3154911 RepID=UPI0033CB22B2
MNLYLGVDGGGSGTALCLVNAAGEVLAETTAPSCYYLDASCEEGVALVERVLTAAVSELCALAGVRPAEITSAFFGLPAYGEVSADVPVLDAAPRAVLGHDRYRCDNDMVCGWAGSLGLADGINVISGTGSMTYGRNGELGVRVGGWGELFGDEGSGYWMGVRGLQAFTQMSDGRLPAGPLLDVLRKHLELAADLDLIDVVLNRWRGSRREVAALSRVVVEAARLGDVAAQGIVDAAATELVRLVETTRTRLRFTGTVPVSYSGGVLTAPEILQAFTARLADSYELREPQYSPVVGAALYAAALAGEPLSQIAVGRPLE